MKTKFPFFVFACMFAGLAQHSFAIDDSSFVYYQKGIIEKNAQRYMVASGYFEKATTFDAKNIQAHLEYAFVNLQMRKMDKAKAAFIKVYELDPTNKVAIENLTELYFAYRQFPKAIEFAQKCPNYASSERIIAMSLYNQEDYATAIPQLINCLSKQPNDAQVAYSIARSYLEMEDYKQAFPFYKTAIELDKTKNSWMYELGLLSYTIDDYKSAVDYFNMAIDNGYPQTNDVLENLGFSYIYTKNFDDGERVLMMLLAKKPGNTVLLRDMAEAFYKNKMYDKSLDFCQKLLEINKNDGKALWQAGLCFQKKGQKDRGQQMCDKAIELDPSLASMRQQSSSPFGL